VLTFTFRAYPRIVAVCHSYKFARLARSKIVDKHIERERERQVYQWYYFSYVGFQTPERSSKLSRLLSTRTLQTIELSLPFLLFPSCWNRLLYNNVSARSPRIPHFNSGTLYFTVSILLRNYYKMTFAPASYGSFESLNRFRINDGRNFLLTWKIELAL